jgi:hypothetical protein
VSKAEISLAFLLAAALAPISPFHLATSPDLIKSNSVLFECVCSLDTAPSQAVTFAAVIPSSTPLLEWS